MTAIMFCGEISGRFLKNLANWQRKLLQSQFQQKFSSCPVLCNQLPRINVELLDSVVDTFEDPNFSPRHHFGKQLKGRVCLPTQFSEAAEKLVSRRSIKTLEDDANILNSYLYNRRRPLESREYRILASKVEKSITAKDAIMENFLSEEEQKTLKGQRYQETKANLLRVVYHWKQIPYDEAQALQYLVCRSAAEYAVLNKIFHEIAKRDPDFAPVTLLDFGSGLGTVQWAANAFWNQTLNEMICVDSSRCMNDIAEHLLRDCNANKPMLFRNTFYRQFLPEAHNKFYDLVTSAYSLMELPSAKDRITTLNTLWRKCSKYLVIVERGNLEGFKLLTEARDFLLKLDRPTKSEPSGHVVSPCPHDSHCPRVMNATDGKCRFNVKYRTLVPFGKEILKEELFSYIVLKKELRNPDDEIWARLVNPPLVRTRHAFCRLCMPDGSLSEVVFTKNKSPKPLYRVARTGKWGDLLPIKKTSSVNDEEFDASCDDTEMTDSIDDEETESLRKE